MIRVKQGIYEASHKTGQLASWFDSWDFQEPQPVPPEFYSP